MCRQGPLRLCGTVSFLNVQVEAPAESLHSLRTANYSSDFGLREKLEAAENIFFLFTCQEKKKDTRSPWYLGKVETEETKVIIRLVARDNHSEFSASSAS